MSGGLGDDRLYGGGHGDTLSGGAGNDLLHGGHGTDRVVYDGGIDDYIITHRDFHSGRMYFVEAEDGSGRDRLWQIEEVVFGYGTKLDLPSAGPVLAAMDDAIEVTAGAPVQIVAAQLTANDHALDTDVLELANGSVTSALGATVTVSDAFVIGTSADGGMNLDAQTVTYDGGDLFDALGAGEAATDSFVYTVRDGARAADNATVTVTVTGVNDAPELNVTAEVTVETASGDVLDASAFDVDGDTLVFSLSGADVDAFALDAATGALRFADGAADQARFDVEMHVTDSHGAQDNAAIVVLVEAQEMVDSALGSGDATASANDML